MSGRPDGNRQDNRQRGNAAQLLEKYKSMARDAQLGGDRVQTEYYLQYAEHYYRVLGESRARFEEQRRARGDDMDDDEGDDDMSDGGDDQDSPDQQVRADNRPQRNERNDRYDRDRLDGNRDANRDGGGERYQSNDRGPRGPRYARNDRNGDGVDRGDGDASESRVAEEAPRAPRPPRNANRGGGERASANVESIAFDALPPAIGAPAAAADEEPAPPKRRVRKPRPADDGSDIAPAA